MDNDPYSNDARDWRKPAGKAERIREAFAHGLPLMWWFVAHPRRAPSAEELAALEDTFRREASVLHVERHVYRSTGLQGNPYVVVFICPAPPPAACVELPLAERACPLYLVQNNALEGDEVNFEKEFGEADNPFRLPSQPRPSPAS